MRRLGSSGGLGCLGATKLTGSPAAAAAQVEQADQADEAAALVRRGLVGQVRAGERIEQVDGQFGEVVQALAEGGVVGPAGDVDGADRLAPPARRRRPGCGAPRRPGSAPRTRERGQQQLPPRVMQISAQPSATARTATAPSAGSGGGVSTVVPASRSMQVAMPNGRGVMAASLSPAALHNSW